MTPTRSETEVAELGEALACFVALGDRIAKRLGAWHWNYSTVEQTMMLHMDSTEEFKALGTVETSKDDVMDPDKRWVINRLEVPHGRAIMTYVSTPK